MTKSNSDLSIKGDSIESIYGYFSEKKYLVNRRYQRKLVWTIEEKESFIDSIINSYPIPLILLAKIKDNERTTFEIIDGMQRLNAIFSFIEQEFSINGEYFDLDTMAQTKLLKDSRKLEQKEPLLDREVCVNIAKYQIPISIFEDSNSDDINDIFKRLNSGGRHLSRQELRQAGTITQFSTIVRKLSSNIRGDSSSSDILHLSQMSQISINNKKLNYGILIDDIFWIKNNIISKEDLRSSKDEEIMAELLAWVTLSGIRSSSSVLDALYGFGYVKDDLNNLEDKINTEIQKKNADNIIDDMQFVFDEISKVIDFSGKTFNTLLFKNGNQSKISRYFQIVFITFYNLLINQNKEVSKIELLIEKLDNAGENVINLGSGGGNWSEKEKKIASQALDGVISDCFSARQSNDMYRNSWISKLENILTQCATEQVLCDFKMGFHSLHKSNMDVFNRGLLSTIIKTLTAMVNSKAKSTGYCFIGIADNEKDAKKFKAFFNDSGDRIMYKDFYITGVRNEAERYHGDMDEYFTKITNFIKEENISDRDRAYILENIKFISYYDKCILFMELESDDKPSIYDNEYYTRHGSNTIKVEPKDYHYLFSKFQK